MFGAHRSSVEKSPGIRHGTVVRGNLIEIMHNACALNIPDSWAVLTRNYFSRLAFRRVCFSRSDKTHALRAEPLAFEGHVPTAELGTLSSRHDSRRGNSQNFFLKAPRMSSLPLTQHRNCRGRHDWHLNYYTIVGISQAAHNAAKWFALECKAAVRFFFQAGCEVRLTPDADSPPARSYVAFCTFRRT